MSERGGDVKDFKSFEISGNTGNKLTKPTRRMAAVHL
jgi:hypothetical protein